jgi:hypothetical protein
MMESSPMATNPTISYGVTFSISNEIRQKKKGRKRRKRRRNQVS